jgi:hypothetical protein
MYRRKVAARRGVLIVQIIDYRNQAITPTENCPGTRDETVEGTPSSRAMVIKPILAEEISENPRCSGNREGLGGFAPIRRIVGTRKKQWYPHE